MSKYIINVKPGEECNPDFYPETDLIDGVEVDEYVIIGFVNRKPKFEIMYGLTTRDIADWIRSKERGAQVIRQACAIAEGEIRAMEIHEEGKDEGITLSGQGINLTDEMIRKIFGKGK